MKRFFKVLICASLMILSILSVGACGKKAESNPQQDTPEVTTATFPEGYTLAGVNVGGMTAEEARSAVASVNTEYELNVVIDEYAFTVSSAELGLAVNEAADFNALVETANQNPSEDLTSQVMATSDVDSVASLLWTKYANEVDNAVMELQNEQAEAGEAEGEAESEEDAAPTELDQLKDYQAKLAVSNAASMIFDEAANAFVAQDGQDCEMILFTKAAEDVMNAVTHFESTITSETTVEQVAAQKASDSSELSAAVDSANSYLALGLSVYFNVEGFEPTTVEISKQEIAKWLVYSIREHVVYISDETLSVYANDLAREHDRTTTVTKYFKTTGGSEIPVKVAVNGITVDENDLYTQLRSRLEEHSSEQVAAVYNKVENTEGDSQYTDFGGTYCELDLTNQHVYVYKNGACVVSAPCVSGCVYEGHATPTGIYSIFARDRDRYLTGDDYKAWVNFFCPFNGGIGFHDASWRSAFGGTFYYYSGSHGCVNLPYDAAKTLYESVSIGTKVIVYGGVTSVPGLDEIWSGQTYYEGKTQQWFAIDVTCQGADSIAYESLNPEIATVDANGYVLPIAPGTCTIKCHAQTNGYTSSTLSITVVVTESETTPEYTVTVQSAGHGTAYADKTSVPIGDTVTLTAVPDEGYKFDHWEGIEVNAKNKFTMPVANVVVTAFFVKDPNYKPEPEPEDPEPEEPEDPEPEEPEDPEPEEPEEPGDEDEALAVIPTRWGTLRFR